MIKTTIKAPFALLQGLRYCLQEPEVRSLAIRPWIIGTLLYPSSLIGVYYLHSPLMNYCGAVVPSEWNWSMLWYGLLWLGIGIGLLAIFIGLSVLVTMLLCSSLHEEIVAQVLELQGQTRPETSAGFKNTVQDTVRIVTVEVGKFFWFLPIIILLLIAGFVPAMAPITLLTSCWLLAYRFIDIVLETQKLTAKQRLAFAGRHIIPLTVFGFTLHLCWAIPFMGILLVPIAVAGASWLCADLLENTQDS